MTTPHADGVLPDTLHVARTAVGPWRAASIVLLSVFHAGGLAVLGWLAVVWADVTTGSTGSTESVLNEGPGYAFILTMLLGVPAFVAVCVTGWGVRALVRRRRSGYTAPMVVGGPVLVAGLTQTHHWQAAALVAVGTLMLLSAVLGYGTASGPIPPPAA